MAGKCGDCGSNQVTGNGQCICCQDQNYRTISAQVRHHLTTVPVPEMRQATDESLGKPVKEDLQERITNEKRNTTNPDLIRCYEQLLEQLQ